MKLTLLLAAALLGASGTAIAQSTMSTDASPPPLPPHVVTQPPAATADMRMVLDRLPLLGAKPIETF